MDLNKVMIIGRLTRDPELRTTPSGLNVCKLGVATSYAYNHKQSGQKIEEVEYHNVTIFGKLGEIANQYLKKGTQVYLEGRLKTGSWEKDGQKFSKTDIIADNMIMLGRPSGQSAGGPQSTFTPSSNTKEATDSPAAALDLPKSYEGGSAKEEELPTIQQEESINVEDIPF